MKNLFFWFYYKPLWRIRLWLYNMLMEHWRYNYYLNVFKKISKIKDVKKNILTKKQKKEIDEYYKKYYGKKVPYMWHNLIVHYNKFLNVRYIPPNVFLEIIENLNKKIKNNYIVCDKNLLYNFAAKTKVSVPKRLFYSVNNLFFDSSNNKISKENLYNQMSNIGEVFIKPSTLYNSGYARNCRIINVVDGVDTYSNTSIKDIIEKHYTEDFIVQEKIVCHKSISDIYPNSANTFSVYTFIWNNEVKILKTIFKIGMGGNFTDYSGIAKDGLIMGINNDGTLFDSALCIKQDKWYNAHPDTGVIFKNHKIINFPKVLETTKLLHYCIPWITFCRWDVTVNVDGEPVFFEAEWPSEMLQQQILYKDGFFGEYTEDILSSLRRRKD